MQTLNFNQYNFRFKSNENKTFIFDEIRKKFIILTPEEWVRQNVVKFLMEDKKYPKSLINVEKTLKVNQRTKRYDIVVFNTNGSVNILVECKAPNIKISQQTFDQIAQYNTTFKATFLMLTNGLSHFYCKMDFENQKYIFLKDVPEYYL